MNRRQRRANARFDRTSDGPGSGTATDSSRLDTAGVLRQALKFHQAGRLTDAEACYRQILQLQPHHADSLDLLGVVAHQSGRHDLAVDLIGKAIGINPKAATYHSNLGVALVAQGKLDEAVACFRQALVLKPDYAEAHFNLGSIFKNQGKLEVAIACYRQALALKPDYAEAHNNLGNAFKNQGKLEEAIACYRQALILKPDFAEAHNNFGGAFSIQGKLDEAIACFRQALVLKPDHVEAHNNLGIHLRQLGRLTDAHDHLEKAISLSPRNPVFYNNLAASKKFTADDTHLAAMQELARDIGSLNTEAQIQLHFALGKALADINQHEQSFRHLLQGNTLKRQQIAYEDAAAFGLFQRIKNVFTSDFMHSKKDFGNPSTVPLFIVGMPRSGSTLVNQILASHPSVIAPGELTDFEKAVIHVGSRARMPFPELAQAISGDELHQLGTSYLDAVRVHGPEAARITDKMPLNFLFVGLIHLALPHARIIHTLRDPVDTCVSCFSTLFTTGQPYSYDLGELGRYYRGYQALMQHWRNVLPSGVMLEVQYEDVVDDLDHQARRLVAHCGLDWDDACLAFHKAQRPVRTASAAQVRQPIYKSAVGRSRIYAEFLAPLLAELGEPNPNPAPTIVI